MTPESARCMFIGTNNTRGRLQVQVHATDMHHTCITQVRSPLALHEKIKFKIGSAIVPQTILVGCS